MGACPMEKGRTGIAAVACLALAGCISVPIPPSGEDAGKYGRIDIRITYSPNYDTFFSAYEKSPTVNEK